jgi:small subunit ribosomal protein S10e
LVAKKDFNLPKHGEIDTKNLYVVKACQYRLLLYDLVSF